MKGKVEIAIPRKRNAVPMVRCPWFFSANGHNFITMMTHLVWFTSTWVLCVCESLKHPWELAGTTYSSRIKYQLLCGSLVLAHDLRFLVLQGEIRWRCGACWWEKMKGSLIQVDRSGRYWFKICVWGIVAGNRFDWHGVWKYTNQVQHDIYDIDLSRLHMCFSWLETLLWQIEVVHGNLSRGILYWLSSKPLGFPVILEKCTTCTPDVFFHTNELFEDLLSGGAICYCPEYITFLSAKDLSILSIRCTYVYMFSPQNAHPVISPQSKIWCYFSDKVVYIII